MVYYTGDIHGQEYEIERFCKKFKPTAEDVIVILGDVGANYSLDERDAKLKKALNRVKPTILCIHGNHEIRPWHIPTYKTKEWHGGIVWYEEEYPTVLFAKDGEIYDLEGLRHIVIGGAYSVDKFYRIRYGGGWWPDEQPSEEIKAYVKWQLRHNQVDVILSHTCPFKYRPVNYGERSSEYNVRYPWEKQVASKSNDITWNVFYHDCNGHKIDTFNIFEHGSFREYMRKAAKKCQTKEEFAKELRSELMYYFWSKCEWEVLISPWVSQRDNQDKKVDVCWQVMNNWDVFLDYVWNNRKKL